MPIAFIIDLVSGYSFQFYISHFYFVLLPWEYLVQFMQIHEKNANEN